MFPFEAQPRLQFIEHRLAFGQLVLGVGRVDLHQHVVLFHAAAAIDAYLGGDAARIAGHGRPFVGHQVAGQTESLVAWNDLGADTVSMRVAGKPLASVPPAPSFA